MALHREALEVLFEARHDGKGSETWFFEYSMGIAAAGDNGWLWALIVQKSKLTNDGMKRNAHIIKNAA